MLHELMFSERTDRSATEQAPRVAGKGHDTIAEGSRIRAVHDA
ncbi:hypothetical protein [Brachybacterium sp. 107]